ncbi:hypothetical protein KP509_23G023400 [Ceratopteris richardii]|uniref:Uncharacterized protein n=1 Tax=Ceratopteris richardii TaxID=49495 RepID=A0A8T2S0E0_CERRI|nr:hypothetical protein KP509_23G023400 [Ceratopteris richardii]
MHRVACRLDAYVHKLCRQRRMYCVACDQWVVSQSEAAEQLARERVEKGAIGSTREIVPHPLPSPEPRPGNISSIHSREPEAGPTPLSRNGVDASNHEVGQNARRGQVIGTIEQDSLQSQQRHNNTAFAIPKLDYSGRTLEQVIPQVSLILTHKLEEIGKALLETQDVHNIRLLLHAIQDCAQTMETLRGIFD